MRRIDMPVIRTLRTFCLCLALSHAAILPAAHKAHDQGSASNLKLSPPGGVFSNPVSVEIGSAKAGATIRYTLDGTEPTLKSSVYSGPIGITNTTLVRAKAFAGTTKQGVA